MSMFRRLGMVGFGGGVVSTATIQFTSNTLSAAGEPDGFLDGGSRGTVRFTAAANGSLIIRANTRQLADSEETVLYDTAIPNEWIVPTSSASAYSIKFESVTYAVGGATTAALSTGEGTTMTVGNWYALTTDRWWQFTLSRPGTTTGISSNTAVVTIKIAPTADTNDVKVTATMTLAVSAESVQP